MVAGFVAFQASDKSTAFHMACGQGSLEIVQLLANHDLTICRITLIDSEGQTPLHRAAANNHVAVVEYLLDQVKKTRFVAGFFFFAIVLNFFCLFIYLSVWLFVA